MDVGARVYVAGGRTLIGSAILQALAHQEFTSVINTEEDAEPGLTDLRIVDQLFRRTRPEYVFLVGGKSAGIQGNQKYPAELIHDNLLIECNVLHAAYAYRAKKVLYLANSCCYPRDCPQPMRPEALMTGPLEPTSEAYAMAKLAGIKICQAYARQFGSAFISGIAADAFGPGDNFSLENSHVVPALIRKMHQAKISGAPKVEIWGTGRPRREYIFVDDLADACLLVMREYLDFQPINLGGGTDVSIRDVAELVRDVVGYDGDLSFNTTKPDGMPFKILDSSKLHAMGWQRKYSLREALVLTYDWFLRSEWNVPAGH